MIITALVKLHNYNGEEEFNGDEPQWHADNGVK